MAVKKKIKRPDGIEINYHRIAMVKTEVGQQTTIMVVSYLNEEGRRYEKDYAAGKIEGEPTFPYVDARYLTIDYDEDMSVKNAYKYLKKHPNFEGAEDA